MLMLTSYQNDYKAPLNIINSETISSGQQWSLVTQYRKKSIYEFLKMSVPEKRVSFPPNNVLAFQTNRSFLLQFSSL